MPGKGEFVLPEQGGRGGGRGWQDSGTEAEKEHLRSRRWWPRAVRAQEGGAAIRDGVDQISSQP